MTAGEVIAYLPFGIVGLVRWLSWVVRSIPAGKYRPVRSNFRAPISVVTPVYREDPQIFGEAIASWLANPGVDEVVCVIDRTDQACLAIARGVASGRVRVIETDVPGKRDALRRGWEAARNDIVALVDSDTIWAEDVADRVCEPFDDPAVGGVGTRQNVLRPGSFLQRITDFYLDQRYFVENAGQTVMGRAVACLSGRTAVYRRRILLEVSDDFMSERFLGVPCNSGEDKRLTMLTLRAGWRTVMQRSARVWSTFPSDARTFLRQRTRWARNTWRSDLRSLRSRWIYRHPFLAFTMLDKASGCFTLLMAPTFMAIAIARGHLPVVGVLLGWWLASRVLKNRAHLRSRPADLLLIPAFIGLSFVMAGVKIYALATLRRQRWLTRPVAVVDGTLVRLDEPASGSPAVAR